MKNLPNTFGQTIHKARKKKKYTLVRLASLITKEDGEKITQQYLSVLENDSRSHPSDRIIQELARVLDIPVTELYLMANRLPPIFDPSNEKHLAVVTATFEKLEEAAAA
jgi:transcriptional regulator with XRE-family HTH domain